MNPRVSLKIYPRPDVYFKNKHSLNFDLMRTKIMMDRGGSTRGSIWFAHVVCGFIMGCIGFALSYFEELFVLNRIKLMQHIITTSGDQLVGAYFFYIGSGMAFVIVAVLLTVYVAPAAMGSGVAEVMGLLNGVNYDGAIAVNTLLVKIFGILMAICSGLCIGKEGPLVHIGANIGAITCYLPFEWTKPLQNDQFKRYMIAAGAACGVSVAFGAPIGGALFSYEISKPNTFWTFHMLWRIFCATCIAVFTDSILTSLKDGTPLSMSDGAMLKFGNVTFLGQNTILDLPAAVIMGIVSGLLGALFISSVFFLGTYRKKYVNTNIRKVIECVVFALVTSSCFYAVVALRENQCREDASIEQAEYKVRWTCPTGQYNPLATLVFNSEKGTLDEFFRFPEILTFQVQK